MMIKSDLQMFIYFHLYFICKLSLQQSNTKYIENVLNCACCKLHLWYEQPLFCPKASRGFNSYQRGPNKPKTSLPFFVWLLAYVCAWAWKVLAANRSSSSTVFVAASWQLPTEPFSASALLAFRQSDCRRKKILYRNYEAWFSNEVKIR